MSQLKNKVVVELWGLPGVGKTTLATALVKEFGYTAFTSSGQQEGKLSLVFKYPKIVFVWCQIILKNYLAVRDLKIFRYNTALLFSSLRKIQYTKDVDSQRVVIDEGLIQRLLSYSDIVYTPKQIKKLLAVSPIGNVVIWVNDREVAIERYTPLHQRAIPGADYLERWKHNQIENIKLVAEVLKQRKGSLFFETKNSSIKDIIEKIQTLNT